ncbi:hypothetical protein MK079_03440 [Candidatus Gracilibacteria bacterium]|nr:hypothetical protein [Candidatus Gracilibacteria bacterium]
MKNNEKYIYCRSFITRKNNPPLTRCSGQLSHKEALSQLEKNEGFIWITDSSTKPSFLLQVSNESFHDASKEKNLLLQWDIQYLDDKLNCYSSFSYTNIYANKGGSPYRFFLTLAIIKSWDDQDNLHGFVPAFGFAENSKKWGKGGELIDNSWEINKKIWFRKRHYVNGEAIITPKELQINYNFDSEKLWVNAKLGEWNEIIQHGHSILPFLKKIMSEHKGD